MPTVIAHHNGEVTTELDPDLLRTILSQQENEVWIDILDPTHQHTNVLAEAFGFVGVDLKEVLRSRTRPHIETHQDYYFIAFHAGSCAPNSLEIQFEPVYIFAGVNFLITVHKHPVPALTETLDRWRRVGNSLACRVGSALLALLDALVDEYYPALDEVADRVDDLENDIFTDADHNPIQAIFKLKKNLLEFRRIVAPERDVVNILLRRDVPIFVAEDMSVAQDLYNRMVRFAESIDLYRDLLSSALDSHVSMQSNRLNETIRVLTVASILLMTNALIAGIYGMNFSFIPELHWTYGYAYALMLMAISTIALIVFFKHKKWL
jgi:magnesium transporter